MMRTYFFLAFASATFLAVIEGCSDMGSNPPKPASQPQITSIQPDSAFAGDTVKIQGADFGSSRGSSKVTFGSIDARVYQGWQDTEIKVQIPANVGSGTVPVTITVDNRTSAAKNYSVRVQATAPSITKLEPDSAFVADTVRVVGLRFGSTQGSSVVTFSPNVVAAIYAAWSDTLLKVKVPTGVTSGTLSVTVNGLTSNGKQFKVRTTTSTVDSVRFSTTVQPILTSNCTSCHSASSPSSEFNQTSYAGVRAGGSQFGANVVIAGDSTGSKIIQKLRGTAGSRMPQGGASLADSLIVKIGKWIMQGAKDN